jgi:hypothetical protein
MELIALKPFMFSGVVLTAGEVFITTSSHGEELKRKGYACAPASVSEIPADPSPPPETALDDVPEAAPDQPVSPTPTLAGGSSAGKRSRKSKS